jgi:undecaprenyl-diphosphatase
MKKTKILFVISLLIFAVLLTIMATNSALIQPTDNAIRVLVNAHRSTVANTFWMNFTQIFNSKETIMWIVITIILSWIMTSRPFVVQVTITLLSGIFLNHFFKSIIKRPRPLANILMHYSGYSFPSGHSCAAALVLGCLVLLTWHVSQRKWLNYLITIFFVCLAVTVGFSRVYVGAHYPSDVIGGLCLGTTLVTGFQLLFSKYNYH